MTASRLRITARFAYRGAPQHRWVLVSGAAHLAAVVVLVFVGSPARIDPPEGFVVQMAGALPAARSASAPTAPPSAETATTTAAPPPQPAQPKVDPAPRTLPEKPKPKPKEPPRPKSPPNQAADIGTNTETAATAQATPTPPSSAAQGAADAAHVGDAGGTVAAVVMGGTEFDWYRTAVSTALFSQWRKPPLDDQREALEALVSFEIEPDGRVRGVRLERSSGVPSLDRSALRAVTDAAPLPPLPRNWRGTSLPAAFIFRLLPEEP